MFRKTRRKIFVSIMLALLLLFFVTITVIILSAYFENMRVSKDMLNRYVQIYTPESFSGTNPDNMPGPPPEDSGDDSLFRLSTFYSVSFSDQGEVLAIDKGRGGLYSEEELVQIAGQLLESEQSTGTRDNLLYQIYDGDDYRVVAFMDITLMDESFHSLVRYTLLAGGIAIAVLLLIAFFLSRSIVKPLEENDIKQKQFISDAGHDLKTPVSIISANADLLSRQIGANEWLDNISHENRRMGNLVNQLLSLSRAENAGIRKEKIDLSQLVTGETLPFESIAFERGMMIQMEIEDGIVIPGSSQQLAQLVSILLENAISHSEGDNTIRISLHQKARFAELTVINSGKEITKEQQEHLFERFYQLDDVRNSEREHYGLGLAIAKAIAGNHNGSISVSCKDGKVFFTVFLSLK